MSSGHHRLRCNNTFPPFPVFHCPQRLPKPHSRPLLDAIVHLFFCRPLLLAPFTVSCRTVFAMSENLEMWLHHLSLCFFTMIRRSSCNPIAFWILCESPHSSLGLCRKCSEVSYNITSLGLESLILISSVKVQLSQA